MIRSLKRRLDALEHRLVSRKGPWPPEQHTFSYHLWVALGKPQQRRGHMDMYLQSAKKFYEEQQK